MNPNSANTTNPEVITAEEKRWIALELRKQRKSYRAISAEMKCSLSAAHGYIRSALDDLRKLTLENAQELRDLEIQKLDAIEEELTKRLDGADDQDAAKISAVIVKTSESRRKLLGIDAPQRVEASFAKGYIVRECSPDTFPPPPAPSDDNG